jgi:plastocyanin
MRILLGLSAPAFVIAVSIALSGCQVARAAAPATVAIKDFAFSPARITIAPGATVTWTNADDEPHTVTAKDKSYKSAALDTGEHYTHTYTAPGEYSYYCSLHPHMIGVVVVKAP